MAFSVPLGDLVVRLTGDATKFQKMVGKAEQRVTAASRKMAAAGAALTTGITLPIAGLGAAAVKSFGDFEDAMTKSTAIMGNVSADLRAEMEATALSISTRSVTSAADLAESYFFLASAGLDAKESMHALGVVERFAVAGAFEMAQATDLLTDAQSALGLASGSAAAKIENMTALGDALVKANTLANASVEQFSRSLTTKSGAALRALNKDMEEGIAVLAAFADQGIKGEKAGEKLAIVLRDLQNSAFKNREEWERLGLSVFDANGKVRKVSDVIGQLEQKFAGMSDEQKKSTTSMLGFQEESFNAIQSLLGTSSKIEEYEAKLREAGGTTERVANRQLRSFWSQLKVVRNQLQVAAIEIGQMLAPMLGFLAQKLEMAIAWWRSLDHATKQWIVAGAAALAALGPLLVGLGALSKVVAVVIGVLTSANKFTLMWLAAFVALGAGAVLLTDTMLGFFGETNAGLAKMVGSFRVGGAQINTWMQAAILSVQRTWEESMLGWRSAWESAKLFIMNGLGALHRRFLTVMKVLRLISEEAFAEEMAKSYARDAMRAADALKTMGDDATKTVRKIKELDRAMEIAFEKDMKTRVKNLADRVKVAAVDAPGVPQIKVPGIPGLGDGSKGFGQQQVRQRAPDAGAQLAARPQTDFQTKSLRRFSLEGLAGNFSAAKEVQAKGVEKRLDELIKIEKTNKDRPAVVG